MGARVEFFLEKIKTRTKKVKNAQKIQKYGNLLTCLKRAFSCVHYERPTTCPNCSYWLLSQNRSSHRRCSGRKGVLRNFAKFTWKHLCQRLFFKKVAGLRLLVTKYLPNNSTLHLRYYTQNPCHLCVPFFLTWFE